VLPGSKSTAADLGWLRATGLADAVQAAAGRGTPVLGICGGYQMLGLALHDPLGVESPLATVAGLGLLPVVTTFESTKTTVRVRARVAAVNGVLADAAGAEVGAYEIHMGRTEVRAGPRPFVVVERGGWPVADPDGATSADGLVVGTYLHGLFADGRLRRALLGWLAHGKGVAPDPRWGTSEPPSARYDRLADAVAAAVDVAAIAKLVGL
jgi:adenosylcobyric acid synthase